MKKITFLIIALVPVLMLAQDVIILNDDNRIENATILSVSESDIIYKIGGTKMSVALDDVAAYMKAGEYIEVSHAKSLSDMADNESYNTREEGSDFANSSEKSIVKEKNEQTYDDSSVRQTKTSSDDNNNLRKSLKSDFALYGLTHPKAVYNYAKAEFQSKKNGTYDGAYAAAINAYAEMKNANIKSENCIETYINTFMSVCNNGTNITTNNPNEINTSSSSAGQTSAVGNDNW